jgi:hypothetical protein
MAEKEEDEEASVFYASFSFFSKIPSRLSLVSREEDPNLSFHFFFFFPSSHPSQARRPPQKSRSRITSPE